jgi:hypothetical protein
MHLQRGFQLANQPEVDRSSPSVLQCDSTLYSCLVRGRTGLRPLAAVGPPSWFGLVGFLGSKFIHSGVRMVRASQSEAAWSKRLNSLQLFVR